MVRHTLKSLGPKVLATRMVRDYVRAALRPGRRQRPRAQLRLRRCRRARRLEEEGPRGLAGVRVEHVESSGVGDAPEVGATMSVRAFVSLGDLTPDDVDVQVVHGRIDGEDRAGRHRRSTTLRAGRVLRGRPAPLRRRRRPRPQRRVRLHGPGGPAQRPARLARRARRRRAAGLSRRSQLRLTHGLGRSTDARRPRGAPMRRASRSPALTGVPTGQLGVGGEHDLAVSGPSRSRAAGPRRGSRPALNHSTNDASTCCSPRGPGERSGSPETNIPTRRRSGSCQSSPVISRPGRVQPGQVLRAAADRRPALEPVPLPQRRVLAPQPQRGLGDLVDVEPGVVGPPVDPRGLVVLAVGVVVAALGAAALVAGGDHRDAVGQAQRRHQVRGLPAAQRDDLRRRRSRPRRRGSRTGCCRCRRGCPRRWPRCACCVVGDQVAHGEPVVGGDEVDRGVRRAAVVGVQVGRAGQPGGDACGCPAVWPRQKSRIASRYWSFHSTHGGGNSPTR